MTTKTDNPFQEFLDSWAGAYIMKNVLSDIDAALTNAKRLQGTSAAKGGSGKDVAEWKKDCALLKSLRSDLNSEIRSVQSGSARSLKQLDAIVTESGEVLNWVEQRNHAYQMLHDAQVDVKLAAMLPVLGLISAQGSQAIVLQRKLEQIIKDLKAAEKASTSKAGKLLLTGLVVTAGTMLPPLGLAGTMFALAASLVTADIGGRAIDYAVGEKASPPDALKTVYTVADSSIASAGQVSKAAEALAKKTAAFGVAWDAADAGHALYKKKNLEKRLNDIVKEAKIASQDMQKKAKQVQRLQKDALAALAQARKNAASFASSETARKKVKKDFKKYHDLN